MHSRVGTPTITHQQPEIEMHTNTSTLACCLAAEQVFFDDAEAAQNEYERGLAFGENKQLEALARAEHLQVNAEDLSYELAECSDELTQIIKLYRAGTIPLAHVGLAMLNVQKAVAQREAGVFAAPEAAEAVRMAMKGLAL